MSEPTETQSEEALLALVVAAIDQAIVIQRIESTDE